MRQGTILGRTVTTALSVAPLLALASANVESSALDSPAACIAGFRPLYLARLR